jgi:hypothetical protein
MSDAVTSSYANVGSALERKADVAHSLYHVSDRSGDQRVDHFVVAPLRAPREDSKMAPLSPIQPVQMQEVSLRPDKNVAELAIRRLTKEIEHAQQELTELETTLAHDLFQPSVRTWLLPLMGIGLALAMYGSFSAANSAQLGATGLMLLWSLGAFWTIYAHDKRQVMAADANRAEIEIWSSRIEELQESLEFNQRIVEASEE